jgi:ABC-type tungstate transport system substrate-binding protein
MIVAQTVLVTPIIARLTRQTIEDLWIEYRDELTAMNLGPVGRVTALIWDARFSLVTRCSPASAVRRRRSAPSSSSAAISKALPAR